MDKLLICNNYENSILWKPGERLDHLFESRCDEFVRAGDSEHLAVLTDGLEMTFSELDESANQLARYLLAQGIKSGDRVGLLLDKSYRCYVALLAVLKVNAAYVPLDPSFPIDRIRFIAQDAEIKAFISLAKFREKLAELPTTNIYLDEDDAVIQLQLSARLTEFEKGQPLDQLCYIIYTSGSTGNPKGVMIEHPSICNFINVAARVYGYTPDDRVFQGMTIAFDFSVEELWVPLIAGATLIPTRADTTLVGADLTDYLMEKQVTALCCVPTLLATIDKELPDLRLLLVSGEACPQDLVVRWHRPGRTILNAYGPTEATVTATLTELSPDKPVTIGQPLPTYTVVILDEKDNIALPRGATGEICLAGIGLAKGYLNRDDLTQKSFIPDFLNIPNNPSKRIYRTGDLGRINENNEIEYFGRIDTQVKIRGYRIELTEIESVLMQLPEIELAIAHTYSPEPGTLELVAYYTLREGFSEIPQQTLADVLRSHLPRYMIPAYIERLNEIPMLPSHKADRKKLPPPQGARFQLGSDDCVEPSTATETLLATTLSEVMKVKHVSINDHFFEHLGAHSLLMAQFCGLIRERMQGIDISMRDIYLNPSIAKLANHLEANKKTSLTAPSVVEAYRIPTNLEYYGCGTLQLLFYLIIGAIDLSLITQGYDWVTQSPDIQEIYLRSCIFGIGLFSLLAALPIAAKWLIIGRWQARRVPIWSLDYLRFWMVRSLVQTNPFLMFKGTPIYNFYLRALGAKIGINVVIETKTVPLCTDLLTIGDGTVLRKDSQIMGYKAQSNYMYTGPISLGNNVLVGEGALIDINTVMENDTQLGHASSLQEQQRVPRGKRYHGSPAIETTDNYLTIESLPQNNTRKILFTIGQLVNLFFIAEPLVILVLYGLSHSFVYEPITSTWAAHLVKVSLALFSIPLIINALLTILIPKLLHRFLKEDKVYPLYGIHYQIFKLIQTFSNSAYLNIIFGDSSAIVHYLKAIGYQMRKVFQTGSNFGLVQTHDIPQLCVIGSGTMVADGLHIINHQLSNSSFKVSKAVIGDQSYLGNLLIYPPDAKLGNNCLIATKALIPITGIQKEGIGILGSPSFEIPRAVDRDKDFTHTSNEEARLLALHRKNKHNLATAMMFLFFQWLFIYVELMLVHAGLCFDDAHGILAWLISAILSLLFAVPYFVLLERATLGFKRLTPQMVSIYDPQFWRVERYWKLNESVLKHFFKGTPFRSLLSRLQGLKIGHKVFDDGMNSTERTLVEIGNYCNLNEFCIIQSHSLEEGVFKSDKIIIGEGCTVGSNSLVHYGTQLGNNVIIDPDSFVMKGETINDNSRWRGNPARAI